MNTPQFTHSPDGHLGFFQFLPLVNTYILVQVFYGHAFSFLKNYFIVLQLQLSALPHLLPLPPPQPNLPPSLAFAHVSFIVVPENPFPHCPLPAWTHFSWE